MNDQFDAIIIGSGAGGAPIAHILAKAGKTVLVLEKGPLFRPQYQTPNARSDFKRDELISDGAEKRIQIPVANAGKSYYSSHVEPDVNDEPHVYRGSDNLDRATVEGYTAQVVGGGTQLYGGVSFRFGPLDFRLATFNQGRNDIKEDPNGDIKREARDWPIAYDDLEPYYTKTEELVGINGTRENQQKPFSRDVYQPPLAPNGISDYARRGMELLANKLQPQNPILWVVQRELGSSNVYFHEVTIPPGTVEGTHQHIGSEELYYIFEGEGIAYMGDADDPTLADPNKHPVLTVDLFGLAKHDVREVKVEPGSVIYTKSGGIHGIRNLNSDKPLRFVAFGYHSA